MNNSEPKKSIFIPIILPIIVAAIVISLVFLWRNYENHRHQKASYQTLQRTAATVFKCLEGAIQSDLQRGNIRCGRLRKVMSNIMAESDVSYLAFSHENDILFASGQVSRHPDMTRHSGEKIINHQLFYWQTPSKKNHCPKKRTLFKSDLQNVNSQVGLHNRNRFLIALDATHYNAQIFEGRLKTNIITFLMVSVVLLLTFLWMHSFKAQNLKENLAIAHERMDRFKEFELAAFGLAHETRHPLGIIRATAQKIVKLENESLESELAAKIIEEADITTARLGEFMNYAKLKEPELTEFEANEFFVGLTDILRPDFEAKKIVLNVEVNEIEIRADRDMLQRSTINLLLNSLKACTDGDIISLSLVQENHKACLKIADTGCGIADEIKDKIFQPYVSGNENGHGIGLAIVKKIAVEHNWQIKVDSKVSEGTCFEICGIEVVEKCCNV